MMLLYVKFTSNWTEIRRKHSVDCYVKKLLKSAVFEFQCRTNGEGCHYPNDYLRCEKAQDSHWYLLIHPPAVNVFWNYFICNIFLCSDSLLTDGSGDSLCYVYRTNGGVHEALAPVKNWSATRSLTFHVLLCKQSTWMCSCRVFLYQKGKKLNLFWETKWYSKLTNIVRLSEPLEGSKSYLLRNRVNFPRQLPWLLTPWPNFDAKLWQINHCIKSGDY